MRSLTPLLVLVLGGDEVVHRLLEAAEDHPLRHMCRIIVAATAHLRSVQQLASRCISPTSECFERVLIEAPAVFSVSAPDRNLSYLKRLVRADPRKRLVVIEEPVCRPDQIGEVRQTDKRLDSVMVDDHWLQAPAVRVLADYLRQARRSFGDLLWVNVTLDESRCIDINNCAPFRAMGGVWGGYLFHAWNLLRYLLPELSVDMSTGTLFTARHDGAPKGLHTFCAFVGLAGGVASLARTRHVALTISGGKGLARDRKTFEFIFERGVLTYSHSDGSVLVHPTGGQWREVFRRRANPFMSVFQALLSLDQSSFELLGDALGTVEIQSRIQCSCRAPAKLVSMPPVYRVGMHPLVEWPADGLITGIAAGRLREWARHVGLIEKPEIRVKLARILGPTDSLR